MFSLCSDEEDSSQEEGEGVEGDAGGGALLHQAGAVTPEDEAMLMRALPLTGYLQVPTAAAADLRCINLGHFRHFCRGPIDERDGGFKCKGLVVSVTVILGPC